MYRDIDGVYGPLLRYLNAALFRLFGPGDMVLIATNSIVYAAIFVLAYGAFRSARGRAGAFAALGVFISGFSFAQYISVANFNYVAPCVHESTHGMLVWLMLVRVLVTWSADPTVGRSLAIGVLLGPTLVLKAEFILACVAIETMTNHSSRGCCG